MPAVIALGKDRPFSMRPIDAHSETVTLNPIVINRLTTP
jgi:hypothetical protein